MSKQPTWWQLYVAWLRYSPGMSQPPPCPQTPMDVEDDVSDPSLKTSDVTTRRHREASPATGGGTVKLFERRHLKGRVEIRCDTCQTPWVTLVDDGNELTIGCPACCPDKGQPAPVKG